MSLGGNKVERPLIIFLLPIYMCVNESPRVLNV